MSYRSNKTSPDDDSFKLRVLSHGATKNLKNYYHEYVEDCQKFGFVPISFSGWIVDVAIKGYLSDKEKRKKLIGDTHIL